MEGISHADGWEEENYDDEKLKECCDKGEESKHEWERILTGKLKEVQGNGFTSGAQKQLEQISHKNCKSVKIRRHEGPTGRVPPL